MDGGSENIILGLGVWLGFFFVERKREKNQKEKSEVRGKGGIKG